MSTPEPDDLHWPSLEAAQGHFMRINAITAAIANPTMKTMPSMNSVPAAMMVMRARYSDASPAATP